MYFIVFYCFNFYHLYQLLYHIPLYYIILYFFVSGFFILSFITKYYIYSNNKLKIRCDHQPPPHRPFKALQTFHPPANPPSWPTFFYTGSGASINRPHLLALQWRVSITFDTIHLTYWYTHLLNLIVGISHLFSYLFYRPSSHHLKWLISPIFENGFFKEYLPPLPPPLLPQPVHGLVFCLFDCMYKKSK